MNMAGTTTNPATAETDERLIQRFKSGDETAFTEIVQKYQQDVFNFIHHHSGRHAEVEDLAQEVFLRVYQHLPGFEERATFRTWLYRITLNVCIDQSRKRRLRRMLSLEAMSEWARARLVLRQPLAASPQTEVEMNELQHRLQEGLARLPEDFRHALVLREMEGLDYDEIAEITQTSLGTVKSRIFRARQRLREMLAPYWEKD